MSVKQVIVVRRDLGMRKGKCVAQGAHASLAVFFNRMQGPNTAVAGHNAYILPVGDWPAAKEWISGSFTKICVGCDTEAELKELAEKAAAFHIPYALITDAGKTEFNGVPTLTALAIGPENEVEIDKITSHLRLL